jgi:hypothetical protein
VIYNIPVVGHHRGYWLSSTYMYMILSFIFQLCIIVYTQTWKFKPLLCMISTARIFSSVKIKFQACNKNDQALLQCKWNITMFSIFSCVGIASSVQHSWLQNVWWATSENLGIIQIMSVHECKALYKCAWVQGTVQVWYTLFYDMPE